LDRLAFPSPVRGDFFRPGRIYSPTRQLSTLAAAFRTDGRHQPPPPPPPDDPPPELPPPLPLEPLELGADTPAASPPAAADHDPTAPAPPERPPPKPVHEAVDEPALAPDDDRESKVLLRE